MDSSDPNGQEGTVDTSASDRVSVKKFAELIGKSYPTAQRLIQEEKVLAIKIGSQYKVSMAEVRRFLTFGNREPNKGD